MPQRLARRAQRRLRPGGGECRLRAVERRLALRVKQAGERSHGLGVRLAAARTHRVEELVHLLQRERVVQRLQRIDGGHHGAAFKPEHADGQTAGGEGGLPVEEVVRADVVPQVGGAAGHPEGRGAEEAGAERA